MQGVQIILWFSVCARGFLFLLCFACFCLLCVCGGECVDVFGCVVVCGIYLGGSLVVLVCLCVGVWECMVSFVCMCIICCLWV